MKGLLRLLFPHRIGRRAFLVRCLLWLAVACAADFCGQWCGQPARGRGIVMSNGYFCVLVVLMTSLLFAVLMPRNRDIGWRGAMHLVFFIPLLNVLLVLGLFLIPGDAMTRAGRPAA